MTIINFFLPMIPPTVTQQEHKIAVVNGKAKVYDPPELKSARQKFISALREHKPKVKILGPVRLITKWIWPLEMLDPGQMNLMDLTGENYFVWKTTKPDTDNMIKLFKDCMTKVGFWKDDCQVVSEITEKMFANQPGIYVEVVQL